MTDGSQNGGCGRYIVGAVTATLFTPLMVGIVLAVATREPVALLGALLFGMYLTAPLVIIGGLLYALIERFTPVRWWHAALAGALLPLFTIAAISSFQEPASPDGSWFLAFIMVSGAFGGLIFHRFARRPDAAKRNENFES